MQGETGHRTEPADRAGGWRRIGRAMVRPATTRQLLVLGPVVVVVGVVIRASGLEWPIHRPWGSGIVGLGIAWTAMGLWRTWKRRRSRDG